MEIEKLNENNFDEFYNLILKLAEYEKLKAPDEKAKIRLKEDGLEKERYHGYVVRVKEKAVAYLMYFFAYSSFVAKPTLFIEDIFVLKEHRGNGIGKELFDFCRKIAKENGCGRVDWQVLDWNKPAIDFYERMGAEKLNWLTYRLIEKEI